jgi:hypothetical protein
MTPRPPDPDGPEPDEAEAAVHAVLDGEAAPDQQRLVARDPALRARLEEMRRVAAVVGTAPEPAPAAELDAIRAKALAALDEDADHAEEAPAPSPGHASAGTGTGGPGTVVPMARRRPRRLPPLPAVAAVVLVLLAIGVGLILTDGKGGDLEAGRSATLDGGASEDAGAELEEEDAPSAEGSADQAPAVAFDADIAFVFESEDELRTALENVDPATLADLAPAAGTSGREFGDARAAADYAAADEVQRCADVLYSTDPAIQPVQAAAPVILAGQQYLVLSTPVAATEDRPASTRLYVVGAFDCAGRFAVQH